VEHPATQTFGKIIAEGVEYQIRWTDVVWLTVSAWKEDHRSPEIQAWCIIQRFVAHKQRGIFNTLEKEVKRFSQPVNPAWAYPNNRQTAIDFGGSSNAWEKANAKLKANDASVSVAKQQARKNNLSQIVRIIQDGTSRNYNSEVWTGIPRNVRQAVNEICRGQVGNPIPRLTDFASYRKIREAHRERGTWRGRSTVMIGSFDSSSATYKINDERERGNIFVYDALPISGWALPGYKMLIRSPDGYTDSSQNRAKAYPPRGNPVEINNIQVDDPIEVSANLVGVTRRPVTTGAGSTRGTGSVALPLQVIPDAPPKSLEIYNILSQEKMDEAIEKWAGQVESYLTALIP
jgi:hypothetical protein